MDTPLSAPFLLLLLLIISFTQISLCCPVDWFSCKGPEANTPAKHCGSHKIKCKNSTLHVQFHEHGPWYATSNLTYPERRLVVHDPYLGEKLWRTECDFLYNFTSPIPNFYIRQIDPYALFDCKAASYNFSRDFFFGTYGCSNCESYDLYYSCEREELQLPRDQDCTGALHGSSAVVEWTLLFQEVNETAVSFSLMSVGFSHRRRPVANCFGCAMKGGDCSPVGAERSLSCSCHRSCPGNMKALKIGLGAGGGFVGLLLLACVGFLCLRHREKKGHTSSLRTLVRSGSSEPSSFGKDLESLQGSYCKTPIFSYEELEEATDGFDPANELGDGGFGVVFKGKLKDGRIVAVKRLYERNYRRVKQFRNEVEILNRLRHRNLVSLYGCTSSKESQDLVLVYEYIPNGTVADHLHGPRAHERALTWPVRMTIAIEAADSLAYLHAHHPQIIHRDVKTSNILLDHSFTVKVADFGLSRLFPLDVTHVSTAPQGTPGYVDPEYHQCYQLTDKSDVYSFGVVLVELISSQSAVDITRPRSEINLSNVAVDRIPRGLVGELVDPSLGFDEDPEVRRMVKQVAEVAFRCLQLERDMRPTMVEVRETLKDIAGVGDCTTNGGGGGGGGVGNPRDDVCLLKNSSPPLSPKSVACKWISSRSTTPHTSA